MKFFIDLSKKQLVKSAASNVALDRVVLKRRDSLAVEIVFVSRNAVATMPPGTTTTVALKRSFSDSNFLALASGEPPTLNLNTVPLEAIFSEGNPATISALLEIRWTVPGETTRNATLAAEVQNSVILGSEGTPETIPDGKATQAQAEAGTDNSKWMTPLRTAQAIAQLAPPPTWDAVLNKPATFPATPHTHPIAQVTGLEDALSFTASAISNERTQRIAGDDSLSQRIDYLTANLDPAALDSIAEAAASIGTLQTQVTANTSAISAETTARQQADATLQAAVAGKAPLQHTHTAAQITDFASAVVAVSPPVDWSSLTGKPTSFPPAAHTQPASSITGLADFVSTSAPALGITATTHTATGNTDTYSVAGLASSNPAHVLVTLNGVTQSPASDYAVDFAGGKIIFDDYPAAGQQIVFLALGLRSVQRPIDPTLHTYAFDATADGLTTYTGRILNADLPAAPALPATGTAWKIQRSTFNTAGRLLTTARATGAWADKESLSYS